MITGLKGSIRLIDPEVVSVFRGDTDRKGNVNKTPVGSVQVVFAWGGPSMSSGEFDRQESAEATSQVFVVKGADVRARDRLERANGQRFAVVGHSMWDQGDLEVFGQTWVCFEVEVMNG